MGLREEVAHLIEEVIVDPLQYQSITQSDRIISKVLDAAVKAAQERQIRIVEAQDSKRDKLSMIVVGNSMIEAINKLRDYK